MAVSIYQKDKLSPRALIEGIKKIKAAFPNLPAGFYDILTERLKINGFSDERFLDAVNNLLDTFRYPTPTVADFISYDRQIRLYTYEEMLARGAELWEMHKAVKMDEKEKPVWVHVDDIKKYRLQIFEPKKTQP